MRRASVDEVAAEGILLLGGARAILLQLADPVVAAGVARHSDFASRPMDRLRGTLTYVYAVMFGTDAQVAAVRAFVDRAHGPVAGAFDAERQLWVAATLYDTAMEVYSRALGPLDAASADEAYREYARLGTALQVPEGMWPASRAEFAEYWDAGIASSEVTADARAVARELLRAREAPWWVRAGMPIVRLVTAGLLPPGLRTAYGLRWNPRLERRFTRWMRTIALVYRALPRRLRTAPSRHYLRAVVE